MNSIEFEIEIAVQLIAGQNMIRLTYNLFADSLLTTLSLLRGLPLLRLVLGLLCAGDLLDLRELILVRVQRWLVVTLVSLVNLVEVLDYHYLIVLLAQVLMPQLLCVSLCSAQAAHFILIILLHDVVSPLGAQNVLLLVTLDLNLNVQAVTGGRALAWLVVNMLTRFLLPSRLLVLSRLAHRFWFGRWHLLLINQWLLLRYFHGLVILDRLQIDKHVFWRVWLVVLGNQIAHFQGNIWIQWGLIAVLGAALSLLLLLLLYTLQDGNVLFTTIIATVIVVILVARVLPVCLLRVGRELIWSLILGILGRYRYVNDHVVALLIDVHCLVLILLLLKGWLLWLCFFTFFILYVTALKRFSPRFNVFSRVNLINLWQNRLLLRLIAVRVHVLWRNRLGTRCIERGLRHLNLHRYTLFHRSNQLRHRLLLQWIEAIHTLPEILDLLRALLRLHHLKHLFQFVGLLVIASIIWKRLLLSIASSSELVVAASGAVVAPRLLFYVLWSHYGWFYFFWSLVNTFLHHSQHSPPLHFLILLLLRCMPRNPRSPPILILIPRWHSEYLIEFLLFNWLRLLIHRVKQSRILLFRLLHMENDWLDLNTAVVGVAAGPRSVTLDLW